MKKSVLKLAIVLAENDRVDFHNANDHVKIFYKVSAENVLRRCGFVAGDEINGLVLVPGE